MSLLYVVLIGIPSYMPKIQPYNKSREMDRSQLGLTQLITNGLVSHKEASSILTTDVRTSLVGNLVSPL